jgi:type IV pilus assembly protein PilW
VMAAVYTAYESQQKAYTVQRQVANMQQNLRAGMFYLSQAIRMAGFDPGNSDLFGLVNLFPAFPGAGATCDDHTIAFTVDDDEDRTIDNNDDDELVAFRLNDRMELQRFSTGAITWQPVAENIEALTFAYLDQAGNPTAVLGDVRSVRVSMTARTARPDRNYSGDGYRRRTMTSVIQCRNLGL